MYFVTLFLRAYIPSQNMSTCPFLLRKAFTARGILTNKPSLTVFTRANGTCKSDWWRRAREGTVREKEASICDESILPLKMLKANMMCCVLRECREGILKWSKSSRYEIERMLECGGIREFSQIRNLCWIFSIRSVWTLAAPFQITLQYSRTDRTWA